MCHAPRYCRIIVTFHVCVVRRYIPCYLLFSSLYSNKHEEFHHQFQLFCTQRLGPNKIIMYQMGNESIQAIPTHIFLLDMRCVCLGLEARVYTLIKFRRYNKVDLYYLKICTTLAIFPELIPIDACRRFPTELTPRGQPCCIVRIF